MHEEVVNLFAAWESFYVIIGSSAAALTGLQFVVMALLADLERPSGAQEIAAFATPNIVHFCSALLISAVFTAPWPDPSVAGRAASLVGVGGLIYAMIVFRRARRQMGYKPVFEDWLWHTILPGLAYLVLLFSGLRLVDEAGPPPFLVGGAALLLVFIGIHNAWDTVTFLVLDQKQAREEHARQAANAPAVDPRTPG